MRFDTLNNLFFREQDALDDYQGWLNDKNFLITHFEFLSNFLQ